MVLREQLGGVRRERQRAAARRNAMTTLPTSEWYEEARKLGTAEEFSRALRFLADRMAMKALEWRAEAIGKAARAESDLKKTRNVLRVTKQRMAARWRLPPA